MGNRVEIVSDPQAPTAVLGTLGVVALAYGLMVLVGAGEGLRWSLLAVVLLVGGVVLLAAAAITFQVIRNRPQQPAPDAGFRP